MTALIVGLLLAVPPEGGMQKLASCLERKDRVCVMALLSRDEDRGSAEYLALAGRAYVLLGRPKDALNAIGQALQLQPGNYDYLMEQGWIYQKRETRWVPFTRSCWRLKRGQARLTLFTNWE